MFFPIFSVSSPIIIFLILLVFSDTIVLSSASQIIASHFIFVFSLMPFFLVPPRPNLLYFFFFVIFVVFPCFHFGVCLLPGQDMQFVVLFIVDVLGVVVFDGVLVLLNLLFCVLGSSIHGIVF